MGSGRLRYGIQLPVQSQSTYYVEPWEAAAGAAEIGAVADAADAAGFDYVAVCDHVAIPRARAATMSTAWYDTVATLAWLAARTTRTRLLSHVYVVAYRHPLATAKAFATLDELSGGRAILGVGAGHVAEEFAALGLAFEERGRRTDDALDAIRVALADEWGNGPGPDGVEVGQRPRPLQPGGPPIWVGGSSPAALRRAGQRGDGWLPQGTTRKEMPGAIATVHEHRAAAGRDHLPFTVGALAPSLWIGEPDWEVGDGCLAGSPERLAGFLDGYAAMGVDQVQVRFRSRSCAELVEQVSAFGADVAPLLGTVRA